MSGGTARVVSLLCIAGLGMALAGCGKGPAGGTSGTAATSSGGAQVVRFATVWTGEPRKSTLEAVAKDFRAAHPEVDLRIEYHQPDTYKQTIRTAAGADDLPDVFFVWPGEWLASFVRGGKVLDITGDLAKDGWGDSFIQNATPLFAQGGRTYGIPMLMQCAYFYYRTGDFADRKLEPPTTWDEFSTVCDAFRSEGVAPIGLSNVDRWPLHHYATILWQRIVGEEQLRNDLDRATGGAFTDPGYLEGLRTLQGMIDKGWFSENPNGTSREAFRQLFVTGRVPMIYSGTWDLGVLQDSNEAPKGFGEQWDLFPFPSIEGGKGDPQCMMGAADGYAVSARCKNREAALTWLRYFTSPETAQRLVSGLHELVCVKGAVNEETADPKLLRYARDLESAPAVVPWADIMLESSVREVFLSSLQGMVDHSVTPEKVLDDLRAAHAKARAELNGGKG
jgi:raffinose/stachyose/melibiose transport system substrate-binding protein